MILEKDFNPRFRLGESTKEFCDCIGLVIYFLKQEGFKYSWEKEVIRSPTKWSVFQEEMWLNGFIQGTRVTTNFPVVIWRNPDQTGHIGIIFEDKIYHMRPNGVQIKQYQGEEIWFYHGD